MGFGIFLWDLFFFVGFRIFVLCSLAKCFEGGGATRRLRETCCWIWDFFVGFGIFVLCLLAKCFEGGGAKRRLRETRTIFLLFLRDGSLYLPLPDIQQFIVEYLKMSENIGRIWKTSDVENLCPVTILSRSLN